MTDKCLQLTNVERVSFNPVCFVIPACLVSKAKAGIFNVLANILSLKNQYQVIRQTNFKTLLTFILKNLS